MPTSPAVGLQTGTTGKAVGMHRDDGNPPRNVEGARNPNPVENDVEIGLFEYRTEWSTPMDDRRHSEGRVDRDVDRRGTENLESTHD